MQLQKEFYHKKELLKGLSKEQISKAQSCKNTEELVNLAEQEGVELTDEQLANLLSSWLLLSPL